MKVRLTLLFVLLLAMLVLIAPRSAAAQGVWLYRWAVVFTFDNDTNGTSIVSLKPPGQPWITRMDRLDPPCIVEGSVTVQPGSGYASFDGGHLKCTFPDIPQIISDMSAGMVSPGSPAAYDDFWMRATIQIDQSASSIPYGNPLFAHQSAEYYVPFDLTTNEAFLRAWTPAVLRGSSGLSLAPISTSTVVVRHLVHNGSCWVRFAASANPTTSRSYTCPQPNESIVFDIVPTTFYVGYSAVQQTSFDGDIYYLEVDPLEPGVLD